ncbi:energy transducer TonB [Mangrovivirga sp. M17]|uniref:Energy transducer TonB n=1 Tax=Mangrovivirga halotolerans TaxID=2993936 RepID=A0ABT3RRA0_9BACT|nr:energy transducer TonB [Mangrovivirga halotolerans]MCX2744308.1 energy transducer TonB [Mangrovivirga halotolerans]
MMRTFLFLFILLTFSSFSQTKKQKVQLIDAETNTPIADALIQFTNGNKPIISDESGNITFLMASYDFIFISHVQYGTNTFSFESKAPAQIKLNKKPVNLGSFDFNLIDEKMDSLDFQSIWNEISEFENPAIYKDDITQFYYDINNGLKRKNYLGKLNDDFSYLISFTVSQDGNIENLLINGKNNPKNDDERYLIELLSSLSYWSPATQNDKKYSRNFSFKIENKIRKQEEDIIKPYPQGGINDFYKYVSENIVYPPAARRMGITGKVYVNFQIDTNGRSVNHKVVRGIGAGCDEEAIRVLRKSPYWIPGIKEGKPVKVDITIPLVFSLN